MRAAVAGSAVLVAFLMLSTGLLPLALPQSPPAISVAGPPAPAPPMLWLKCGVFDPLKGLPPLAPELTLGESQGYFVVQFDGPVTADRQDWLSGASEVLAYLPDYAYVVRGADPEALRAHAGVRYVGPFEPAYKVAPRLSFTKDVIDLAVQCFARQDTDVVVERLGELGAAVMRSDPLMIQIRAPGALALAIARIPQVQWVEEYHAPVFENNADAKIIRVRSPNDGAYNYGTTGSLWSYNPSTGKYEGYAGANFTAALVDTGIDGSHPAFTGKKVAYYAYGYSDWTDYDGHGTHTAGTVLGNGAYRATDPGHGPARRIGRPARRQRRLLHLVPRRLCVGSGRPEQQLGRRLFRHL
jgi:serine protease AprX